MFERIQVALLGRIDASAAAKLPREELQRQIAELIGEIVAEEKLSHMSDGEKKSQLGRELQWVARDGQRAKSHLLGANLRLVVHLAKRYQRDALRISTVGEDRGHGDIFHQALTVSPAEIEIDPDVAEENSVVLPWAEPRSFPLSDELALTYEGAFAQRTVAGNIWPSSSSIITSTPPGSEGNSIPSIIAPVDVAV